MVSWVGDGLMAGFSPSTNQLEPDVYHFASPGSVDVNAITRFQYSLPPGADEDDYPNRLRLKATFNFTSGDIADHSDPDRWLTLGAFLARADQFAAGVTPTPQQIINLGYNNLGWAYPANETRTPGNETFTIDGWWGSNLSPGTKYWVLLIPCFKNLNFDVPIRPMKDINVNVLGRAMSFWTNRTPVKPVITSPANNLTLAAGSVFNLAYNPDPDWDDDESDSTNSGTRYDRDLAGVQVAYSALPTTANPNPQFYHLPFKRADNGALTQTTVYMNQADVLPGDGRIAMIENLGFPVIIGPSLPDLGGRASIPAGSWQIKVRVADYGNPYPKLANEVATKYPGSWSMNKVPDLNVSPWSDVIRVHVFQQVPPPIPLSPRDNHAMVETSTIRLAWQYRNTNDPPYDQLKRTVQIRLVGEEIWHTILDNQYSADTFVDLLPGYSPEALPGPPNLTPTEYLTDGGFESGTTGGWLSYTSDFGVLTPQNVAGSAGTTVHTGTKALRLDGTANALNGYLYTAPDPVDDGHNLLTFSAWVRMNSDMDYLVATMSWRDADGNVIGSVEEGTSYSTGEIHSNGGGWLSNEWVHLTAEIKRPNGAVDFAIAIVAVAVDLAVAPAEWIRLDDVSVIGSYVEPENPLVLEATNHYEWQVKVEDTDFEVSSYSEAAVFWIVPAGGSGEVKPIAEDTIDGATLGCGTHRVFVYRRGGKERVGEIKGLSHVDWSRVRDDISSAKIIVEDWDIDCGNLLAKLQTWAYELVIFRNNGYSVDRVWEGPISLLTYETTKVTIHAKDVMNYAYRRIIKQKFNDSGNGDTVVGRATRILQTVFAPDDPNVLAYLRSINNASDSKQYRSIPAYSRTAYEEIDDMAANAGLDYTCVGRAILLWGTKSRIGTLPEFRDKDLGASPVVSEYGMSMANVYSVSDGNGIHGEADRLDVSGNDPIYGLVEMLSSTWASDAPLDTGTYTQQGIATIIKSFEEYAERSISDRYPPPVVVRVPDNTTLNPGTVLSIQQLVPGVVIPLRSTGTLRQVVADQKLDSITVTEESGSEKITVTLSPFSREDTAQPEGEGDV